MTFYSKVNIVTEWKIAFLSAFCISSHIRLTRNDTRGNQLKLPRVRGYFSPKYGVSPPSTDISPSNTEFLLRKKRKIPRPTQRTAPQHQSFLTSLLLMRVWQKSSGWKNKCNNHRVKYDILSLRMRGLNEWF